MKMKHIDIIQNYSGVTEMIANGQLSPNFLVKSENDQKVYFSNAAGLRLVVDSGNTYNMYAVGSNSFEADFSSTSGFSFRILDADNQYLTTTFDWNAEAMEWATVISQDSGSSQNENHFVLSWAYGDTSWQVIYDSVNNIVQVTGSYTLTDEEACTYHGGTWDPVNQECVMPTCEEQGLCGDDPYDCHECTCQEQFSDPVDVCACEGGYFWDGECHEEPEPEDPCAGYETQEECECVQQGGSWEGSECVMPSEPAEGTCEEQGLCDDGEGGCVPCPDPCDEYEEGTQEKCECQGGTWDGENCNFDDPCGDASPEECECIQQGGTWDGSHGSSEGTCNLPADDPCADAEDPAACECEQQGGTWDGSTCNMPSDE